MANVVAAASRQVSTTVTLAHQLNVGGVEYPISYLILPYTTTPDPMKAADLLFYIDVFSNHLFELRPHMDGVQSLYHRHHPDNYNPLWIENAYGKEIVNWGYLSTIMMDDDLLKGLGDEEKEVAEECDKTRSETDIGFLDETSGARKGGSQTSRALRSLKSRALGSLKSRALGSLKSRALGSLKSRALGSLKSRALGSLKSRALGSLKSRALGSLKSRALGSLKSRALGSLKSRGACTR